jgi:hypothetical protein
VNSDVQVLRKAISRIAPDLVSNPDRHSDMWDLDEIFWKNYQKPWNVDRAVHAFMTMIDYYLPWSEQLAAVLQIWLGQVGVLQVEAPSLIDPMALDTSSYHPPSVGLIKKVRPIPVPYEVYRVPISLQLVNVQDGDIRAYYECFRTPEAQAAGEPYDCIVVLQHWAKTRVQVAKPASPSQPIEGGAATSRGS